RRQSRRKRDAPNCGGDLQQAHSPRASRSVHDLRPHLRTRRGFPQREASLRESATSCAWIEAGELLSSQRAYRPVPFMSRIRGRHAKSATSCGPKLPEVADEPLPFVDAPEAELHGHLEADGGGIAVGELTVEAAASVQIGRHHHGGWIGAG